MPIRRRAIYEGDREMRRTAQRFAEDFRGIRERAGVSQAAVAATIGVARSVICRMESGDPTVSPAIRARACACLGADFRMQVYAERAPMIFDVAHARIVERILATRNPRWRATVEAPLAGPGRRSTDIRLDDASDIVLIEVETHVRRSEEIVREVHSNRDAMAPLGESGRKVHVVLALPPTRHHQQRCAVASVHRPRGIPNLIVQVTSGA